MLSSVRVGKRKRKKAQESKIDNSHKLTNSINNPTIQVSSSTSSNQIQTKPKNSNAADLLRRQLHSSLTSKQTIDNNNNNNIKLQNDPIHSKIETKTDMKSSDILSESVVKRMKQSNPILSMEQKDNNTIVLNNSFSSSKVPAIRIGMYLIYNYAKYFFSQSFLTKHMIVFVFAIFQNNQKRICVKDHEKEK